MKTQIYFASDGKYQQVWFYWLSEELKNNSSSKWLIYRFGTNHKNSQLGDAKLALLKALLVSYIIDANMKPKESSEHSSHESPLSLSLATQLLLTQSHIITFISISNLF